MAMLAQTPPMGFNTWNTFGPNINEQMMLEITDVMVERGYRDAGYKYVVIDDCWSMRERNENGELVADPEKFPHGMKFIADYVHSKGLKFGMYSCAGIRTCAGFPSSFDHEYQDARTFASWGVDFLKYDFCYFPSFANCQHRYLQMAMALRASGRDILFSACNWGVQEPWNWMRSIGAHMYRSTGDIVDTFASTADIAKSQIGKFNANAAGCFNDMDMLTIGMNGQGNVGRADCNNYVEYEMQFAYWCFCGAPTLCGRTTAGPQWFAILPETSLQSACSTSAGTRVWLRSPSPSWAFRRHPASGCRCATSSPARNWAKRRMTCSFMLPDTPANCSARSSSGRRDAGADNGGRLLHRLRRRHDRR